MANILADVGRSNLHAIGSDLMKRAVDIRREETAGYKDLLKAKMEIGRYNTEMAEAERNKREEEIKLRAMEEREKLLNTEQDVTVNPIFLALPEPAQKQALEWGAKNGYWDETGVGTLRNHLEAVKQIESSKSLFSQFMAPVVEAKKERAIEAYEALQNAKSTGADPEKIKKLMATHKIAVADYGASLGKFRETIKTLEEKERAEAMSTPQLFMAEDGTYHRGYFDKSGNLLNDLGPATERQLEGQVRGKTAPMTEDEVVDKITEIERAIAEVELESADAEFFKDLNVETDETIDAATEGDVEAKERLKAALEQQRNYYRNKLRRMRGEPEPQKPVGEVPSNIPAEGIPLDIGDRITKPITDHSPRNIPAEGIPLDIGKNKVKTGVVEVPVPPHGLPDGARFLKTLPNGDDLYTDPNNPGKGILVKKGYE